jgi:hypothetical protein
MRNKHYSCACRFRSSEEGKGIAMRKRKKSVSQEAVQAPKEQEVPLYPSWQPSRLNRNKESPSRQKDICPLRGV